jgi:hypothetical protein
MQGPGRLRGLKGLLVTPVRRVLRETLPVAAASAGGEAWAGGSGRGENCAHCGTGFGVFEIKGLAARVYFAFTDSSPPAPTVAPAPASPRPDGADQQGQDRGRETARGTCGNGWARRAAMTRADQGPGPATGLRRLPWVPGGLGLQGAGMGRIGPEQVAGRGLTAGG